MERVIGGYFELELANRGSFIHDDGVLLNSGKNAFEHILQVLKVRHIWVPYYTCDVVLSPLTRLHIPFSFYHISYSLDIQDSISIGEDDYLLYTNYYGIRDSYIEILAKKYGSHLIVDNSQALYSEPLPGIPTFYSPRKFVGVPDGGIAYCNTSDSLDCIERELSYPRCSHLLKRIDLGPEEGYLDFKHNDRALAEEPVRRMSVLTEILLKSIDFEKVKIIRRRNFQVLFNSLHNHNLFEIPEMSSFQCPLMFPFLTQDDSLKQRLIENRVFVATYWPNVLSHVFESDVEFTLVKNMISIPCDQRYDESDMKRIISIVLA